MREKMRALRMSPRTEDSYVYHVADFLRWTNWTRPESLTTQQVTDYLSSLATERNVAASTLNQAQSALMFMLEHRPKPRRSFKESHNLLTRDELAKLRATIPAKYMAILESCNGIKSIRTASRKTRMMHHNSPVYSLHGISERELGRRITVCGFIQSKLLHEIAAGLSWQDAELKYGAQKVKTACASLVRQFPNTIDCLCEH